MTTSIKFKTLWIGSELSLFERACLSSFVKLDQSIELFAYEELKVPKGVLLRDASKIIPKDQVRKNVRRDSYSTFSDLFRYEMLRQEGGCWVDTDVILLKVPQWPETVLGYQSEEIVNCAVLSLPVNICEWLIEEFRKNGYDIEWDENGPGLVTKAANKFGLSVLPSEKLYPIHWKDWKMLFGDVTENRLQNADCVHIWNEMFRINGVNKNQMPTGWLGKKFREVLDDC
jgi:hypothetical protein